MPRKAATPSPAPLPEPPAAGALYLVGTPIGNLEDISLRALRILKEAGLIACEDTRQTQKLLNHYDITTRTTAYHEHNEMTKAPQLVLHMEAGMKVALVSDAGMPGISDPGYRLVHLCARHGIRVVPVPGPSAIVASLVASGLPTNAFQFAGFLPPKDAQRRKLLQQLADYRWTTIAFEAPHRIIAALQDVLEVLGDRQVVVARELTKVHEEFLSGPCSQVLEQLRTRPAVQGEMTLLITGSDAAPKQDTSQSVRDRVGELMRDHALSRMEALKTVARERDISKSQVYREYQS